MGRVILLEPYRAIIIDKYGSTEAQAYEQSCLHYIRISTIGASTRIENAILTDIPRRTVTRALEKLVKVDFLQRLGQGPETRYQLIF